MCGIGEDGEAICLDPSRDLHDHEEQAKPHRGRQLPGVTASCLLRNELGIFGAINVALVVAFQGPNGTLIIHDRSHVVRRPMLKDVQLCLGSHPSEKNV